MKRVVATLAALALILAGCGSWFSDSDHPVHPVHLVAGTPAETSLLLGGDRDDPCKSWSSAQGLLVTDPKYGTAIMDNTVTGTAPVPVVWPPNFTGAASGSEVMVLDPQGNVVAVTGNEYRITGGPVADVEPDPNRHGFGLSWPGLGVPEAFWACGRVTLPVPPPAPVPTVDPEVLRKTARADYLEAGRTALTAKRALDKKYPTHLTLEQAVAYYHKLEKIDERLLVSWEAIEVPPDMEHDFQALTVSQFRLVLEDRRTGGARSMASLKAHKADLTRAQDAVTAAANKVRADLKLPPSSPE